MHFTEHDNDNDNDNDNNKLKSRIDSLENTVLNFMNIISNITNIKIPQIYKDNNDTDTETNTNDTNDNDTKTNDIFDNNDKDDNDDKIIENALNIETEQSSKSELNNVYKKLKKNNYKLQDEFLNLIETRKLQDNLSNIEFNPSLFGIKNDILNTSDNIEYELSILRKEMYNYYIQLEILTALFNKVIDNNYNDIYGNKFIKEFEIFTEKMSNIKVTLLNTIKVLQDKNKILFNNIEKIPDIKETYDVLNNYINMIQEYCDDTIKYNDLKNYSLSLRLIYSISNKEIFNTLVKEYFKDIIKPSYLILQELAITPFPKIRGMVRKNCNISSSETF
jgi:hypothetical protein